MYFPFQKKQNNPWNFIKISLIKCTGLSLVLSENYIHIKSICIDIWFYNSIIYRDVRPAKARLYWGPVRPRLTCHVDPGWAGLCLNFLFKYFKDILNVLYAKSKCITKVILTYIVSFVLLEKMIYGLMLYF